MDRYIIVTFDSVNFAMQTEAVLKEKSIEHQIIPTPREITLSCGLSIKTSYKNLIEIKNLSENKSIKIKKIYSVELNDNKKEIKAI